jgi:hypothetical protein
MPGNRPNPVKAIQAELCSEPQITIGRLSNFQNRSPGKTIAHPPYRMRVLADVERGVKREGTGGQSQQNASQFSRQRDKLSCSLASAPHNARHLNSV